MSTFMSAWRRMFSAATDAPLSFAESAGLMVLSTFAQGKRTIQSGKNGVRPNLFMMVVGPSSVSRKTTSVQLAEEMVKDCDPALAGPKDYTMEGLIKWMSKDDRSRFSLFADEFGSDLARGFSYNATMKEDFCQLYDGNDWNKVRAVGKEINISRPRVGLYAAAAYQMLAKYLKSDDWASGFMMRFLYVAPVGPPRPSFEIQPDFPHEAWATARSAMLQIRDVVESKPASLSIAQRAAQHFSETMAYVREQASGSHIFDVYSSRFATNIQKLALLYQIDMDPFAPAISLEAMREATQFAVGVCWPSMRKTYSETTSGELGSVIEIIADRLIDAGDDGVSTNEIFMDLKMGRHVMTALNILKASHSVAEQRVRGEPTLVWVSERRLSQ